MRGILTTMVCVGLAGASFAQQDPQYTQYMFDRLSVNPGVAGTSGNICITALLRQQWTGFEGAPKTGLLNLQMPIAKISSGIGISAYSDQLGQEKTTAARLHYSFHRKFGPGTFGAGLYLGFTSRSLGHDWVAVDPVADDNAIPDNGASAMAFDLGIGLYYVAPTFWAGISSTQIPESKLKDVNIQNARHYYLQAGYDWAIGGNKKYVLQPSVLVKTDASSTVLDVNATFLYNNMVWLGVSYRTEDAIAPMIGYQHEFKNGNSALRLGYSYDVTTSQLKNYSSGSHEVMLNYCFKIVPQPKTEIYRNVRFL
ncbi:MAG: type IX secretion system membrane protein PorP/SprF [Flavobacteriales bacterium]|nr:type IX secretion system membrane protein PorP/SprF [Flavobacteriales bacterium]MCB9170435.1 type IX secretion system membrane protein PorP/SprF [Flavobacteriales bacterium]MCB9179672.1 type IX secretion system membrane protein PorP/SprF [Flavobacteriales bacterium]